MKILDKIVVSKNQPKSKNVLWYDSESGEQKAFTSKGWEAISGKSGGYPVVTINRDFNINASPNIYYDIQNTTQDEINITCDYNYYSSEFQSKLYLVMLEMASNEELAMQMSYMTAGIGVAFVANMTSMDYKYSIIIPVMGNQIVGYCNKLPEHNKQFEVYFLMDEEGSGEYFIFDNISIINQEDYIYYVPQEGIQLPVIIKKMENNDLTEYNYKYQAYNYMYEMDGYQVYLYTVEDISKVNTAFAIAEINGQKQELGETSISKESNVNIFPSNVINEFVFKLNSPANVVFNNNIKWNNNNVPDLTLIGNYTISIVDGVGCYTYND